MSRKAPEIDPKPAETVAFGGFVFLAKSKQLQTTEGKAVDLRSQSTDVLSMLAARPGEIVSKDALMQAVWADTFVTDDSLTQCIADIRRASEDSKHVIVETVPKRGYRLNADELDTVGPNTTGGVERAEALDAVPRGHRTLAVPPFLNLSSDPEQGFFAAGLGLDLESALGLIGGIELRPDRAVADFELTGSVRAASGLIRVTARLAEVAGGRQHWSGRFEGRAADIFALQDEITRKVAVAMQVELTTGDYARLWDGQTASLAAWERYVVAHGHFLRWTEADNRRARDLLIEALEIDPDYLSAKVMLGKTWWYEARFYTQGNARTHAIAEAEGLAREVLECHSDTASAVMLLGQTAWLCDRHDEAVALCRRACDLSPSDSWLLGAFGVVSIFSGDLGEALAALGRAARLSPQTFTWIDFHIGHARAWAGDDAGAQASLHSYVAAEPQDPWGHLMLAVVHGFAGRPDDARRAVAEALRRQPDLDQEQVRRSHRYRDPARQERMIAVLNAAGLPA